MKTGTSKFSRLLLPLITLQRSSSPAPEETFECIHSNKLDFVKLCGQNYDGASGMSGVYTGETRIRSRHSQVSYVHCASHNLNPVPNNTMTAITQVMDYFSMAEVYTISIMEMLWDKKQSHYIRLAWKLASETTWYKTDFTGWLATGHCLCTDKAKSLLQAVLLSKDEEFRN